jgi:hypothetical protein
LEDGIVYFRRAFCEEKWKRIFTHFHPIEISCDGCNLAILDNTGTIHYIKSLSEDRKKGVYSCKSVLHKQKWTDSIWGIPWFRRTMGEPTIDPSKFIWGASHKGLYQWYYQVPVEKDSVCQPSPKKFYEWKGPGGVSSGVTTFFFCKIMDDRVSFIDPLGSKEGNTPPVPEGKIEFMAVSASNLCVITRTDSGQRKMYSFSTDYDLAGMNAIYNVLRKETINKETWYEQELPSVDDVVNLTVTQRENGNFNCEIWVATTQHIYKKKLYEKFWTMI